MKKGTQNVPKTHLIVLPEPLIGLKLALATICIPSSEDPVEDQAKIEKSGG